MISWEKMINNGNPNTFTVPITVVNTGQSILKHNTFMSVGHEMTMKQVKQNFVKAYLSAMGLCYSSRKIEIIIEGKKTSDEKKCKDYNIDSSTCLEINIL